METRIEVAERDHEALAGIGQTVLTLEGVNDVSVDEERSTLVVDHDPDVISGDDLISRVGSEVTGVVLEHEQPEPEAPEAKVQTEPEAGSETEADDRRPQRQAERRAADEPAETTTTGDPSQDVRGPGDGAEQDIAELARERKGEDVLGHSEDR